MSEKNLDNKGRWRNVTIGFRVSKEENDAINEVVALSGLMKQEYIVKKLLNRDVVVTPNPRVHKALKDKMGEIYEELQRIENAGECSEEFLDTIGLVAAVYIRMDGQNE